MTNQEMYNKVRDHLLKQNARSVGADGKCAYRGTDGRMCAVGCLISDKDYRPEMEGKSALDGSILEVCGVSNDTQENLLWRLQCMHDNASWKTGLRVLAKQFGLTP